MIDFDEINKNGRLNCQLYDNCLKVINTKLRSRGQEPSPCISPVACMMCYKLGLINYVKTKLS